jgi:hypothetical protein
MKNIKTTLHRTKRGLLLTAMATFFVLGGSQLRADDWGGHQRYYDRDGFYDGQRHYHQYDHYRDHRGYWDERNGVRIFINVG